MIMEKVVILGAGVGGLGAGVWLKSHGIDFTIIEGKQELPLNLHNGVHYLHDLPELPFTLDFDRIPLFDGVMGKDGVVRDYVTLQDCLEYSFKVLGVQQPSSVLEVGKIDKVIMPKGEGLNELIKQMYEYIGADHFMFGAWTDSFLNGSVTIKQGANTFSIKYSWIVSTVPLDVLLKIARIYTECEFKSNPIHVYNFNVNDIKKNWLINIYFPDPDTPIYRASVMNGVCSTESTKFLTDIEIYLSIQKLKMFNLEDKHEYYNWNTGKVLSIEPSDRKRLIEELYKQNIFTLGRFGLWNRRLLVNSTINQAHNIADVIANKDDWERVKLTLSNL